jgi:hypothetical protein
MKEKRLEIEKRKTEEDLLSLRNEILGVSIQSNQPTLQVDQQQISQDAVNQPGTQGEIQPQTQIKTQQAEENGKEKSDQSSVVS